MAAAGTQQFSDAKVELGQLNTYENFIINVDMILIHLVLRNSLQNEK